MSACDSDDSGDSGWLLETDGCTLAEAACPIINLAHYGYAATSQISGRNNSSSSSSGGGGGGVGQRANALLDTISTIEDLCDSGDELLPSLTSTGGNCTADSIGYVGSNSVDSGYKSACPTPDPATHADAVYAPSPSSSQSKKYPTATDESNGDVSSASSAGDIDHLASLRQSLLNVISRYDAAFVSADCERAVRPRSSSAHSRARTAADRESCASSTPATQTQAGVQQLPASPVIPTRCRRASRRGSFRLSHRPAPCDNNNTTGSCATLPVAAAAATAAAASTTAQSLNSQGKNSTKKSGKLHLNIANN